MESNPAVPPLLTFAKMPNYNNFKCIQNLGTEPIYATNWESGQAFIRELAEYFSYTGKLSLERIVVKCAMILPSLILQKCHPKSR